jgi:hypothetical protein
MGRIHWEWFTVVLKVRNVYFYFGVKMDLAAL